MEADRRAGLVFNDVIGEAVRAQHDLGRRHGVAAGVEGDAAIVADDDTIHEGLIHVPEAIRVRLLEVGEHLLDEEAGVGAALDVGEDRPIPVVRRFEEFADVRLGHDRVEPCELGWDLVEELGLLRHDARFRAQVAVPAKQAVPQVHLEVVEAEHAHMTGEPLDAHLDSSLGAHQVEQVVGVVERPLGLDRRRGPELVGDIEERTLEVRRELPGIAPGRARAPHGLARSAALGRLEERSVKKAVATPAIPAPTIAMSVVAFASRVRGGPSGAIWAIHGDRLGWSE